MSWSVIKGLALGLEYVDLDEEDQKELETDGSTMIILSLAFIRIIYIS